MYIYIGIVSLRVVWGSTIRFLGRSGGWGAFVSQGKQAAVPGQPCVFPGGVRWGGDVCVRSPRKW